MYGRSTASCWFRCLDPVLISVTLPSMKKCLIIPSQCVNVFIFRFLVPIPPTPIFCNEGDVRLVDGTETDGRVEVCLEGQWIPVCDTGFDFAAVEVVCGQLGFNAVGKFLACMHTYHTYFHLIHTCISHFMPLISMMKTKLTVSYYSICLQSLLWKFDPSVRIINTVWCLLHTILDISFPGTNSCYSLDASVVSKWLSFTESKIQSFFYFFVVSSELFHKRTTKPCLALTWQQLSELSLLSLTMSEPFSCIM